MNPKTIQSSSKWGFLMLLGTLSVPSLALAQIEPSAAQELGGPQFTGWTGLQKPKKGVTQMALPGEATFLYAPLGEGKKEVPSQSELRNWYNAFGVRFDVRLDDERPIRLGVRLATEWDAKDRSGPTASTLIQGRGWHTVSLPWKNFDFRQSFAGFLGDIKGLSISALTEDGAKGQLSLRSPQLVRGDQVWLHSDVRGQSVEAGGTAQYQVLVGNSTNRSQGIALSFEKTGYQAMVPTVSPSSLLLSPGEVRAVNVRVSVPSRVPAGGNETQVLRAIGNGTGSPSDKIEFVTASRLAYPNILHTKEGWDEVRAKVKNYAWAKDAQKEIVTLADNWNVPQARTNGDWLFATQEEYNFMAAGQAYQLTSDPQYAEKVKTFLLRLSNPVSGYPQTRRASNQASVQEGHFFQHIAMSYDMTIPSGVYSPAERAQIDATLRLFIGPEASVGNQISNWNVSSLCGSLYCALVLQDLASANRILYAPHGIIDQLRYGALDDGWWYELSVSYNTWVATEFSQVAIAMRPWGLDLANMQFPSGYRPDDQRVPEKTEYGITDAKWGPIHNTSIGIKRMWDVLPVMSDYKSTMFGINDTWEKPVGGEAMEIAYYLYRDPAYVSVIKRSGGKRDLIYGVPELPENTPDFSALSTFADNAGVALLRSQTDNRERREQIQAVLRYGDHGWYHGHFDITDLLHISRYGRSFFSPEFIWYGYPNFMYKFYVQTSVNKNMVVVDQKQQEPTPNERLLFHSGKMMQAAAVQVNARWSNPPYGGIRYEDQPYKTFAEKAFAEGRSVPTPANPPLYEKFNSTTTSLTGYTEPILQRRLMLVTDDYVVVDDYVKAAKEHTFDSVFQMKGFQGLEGADKKLLRHDGQWNPDPVGSAQFVTDADWYSVSAPARGSFQFKWGPGADNAGTWTFENTEGVLNMDLHTLWPPKQEIMLAMPPEDHQTQRQVTYAVRGDGKVLTDGKSGMWILGEKSVDVALDGLKSLELETQTGTTKPATLFWAGACIVTRDGKQIPLSSLPLTFDNTQQPAQKGQDFFGGPIKIAGIPYSEATSAQPQDGQKPSLVRVDLSGLNAVRFKSVLGGDYPLGDESQRRKTVAVRSVGTSARFLTVLEPFENKSMVKSAIANGPDTLRVELNDGRTQDIRISGMDGDGKNIVATVTESRDGKTIRTETTTGN